MMVRVLPLPAPANTSSGPSPWVTASRCGSLSSVMTAIDYPTSLTLRPRTHKTRANGLELLYARAMRLPRPTTIAARWDGVGVTLPASPVPAQLPEECACCAEAASHRSALTRADGTSLLVGYCDECAE